MTRIQLVSNITFSRSSYRGLSTTEATADTSITISGNNEMSLKDIPVENKPSNAVVVDQVRKTIIVRDNYEGQRAYKIVTMQGFVVKTGIMKSSGEEVGLQDLAPGIYLISLPDCAYRFILN